jgi:hypothetical protein
MDGMLIVAMLLRSRVLGTVEGGGDGSNGIATVRRGVLATVEGGGDGSNGIATVRRGVLATVEGGGDGSNGIATVRWGVRGSVPTLLRSRVLGTVEGGGDGSNGMATVRRGVGGSGTGSSAIEAVSSCAMAERRIPGIYETISPSDDRGGLGRVKFPMTVDHSLMGRSWDMRTTSKCVPFALRSRRSTMCCCWRSLLCWRWMSRDEVVLYLSAILSS